MNWFKRYLKFFRFTAGLILLGGGIFVSYWWFYKLVPMRHLADPRWRASHSAKACWEEEQEKYRRMSASPDLCDGGDQIGYYGDKQWFLWLVGKMQAGRGFRVCGCTETALMFMSNHEGESWPDFVKQHSGQTQEEWILDGFKRRGISVHLPPKPEDTLPLLRVLACPSWNTLFGGPQGTNTPEALPDYIRYNAFRWLRDSGFRAVGYTVSNSTALTSEVVRAGIVHYMSWAAAFPRRDAVGILAFGQVPDDQDWMQPRMNARWFKVTACSLAIVPTLAGCFLLLGRRKKCETQPATSDK